MASTKQSPGEIRSLTGLRGVAAVFVVLYHALHAGSPLADFILGKGYLSVDVFFVLSGFVMALTYGKLFVDGAATPAAYLRFLGVRLARIYPLYIVVTLLYALLAWAGLVPLFYVHSLKWTLLWNVTLLQSLSFGGGNVNLAAWSLSTEWVAYLVFPVFAWWILVGAQRRVWLAVGLAVIVLVGLAWASLAPPDGITSDGPLSVFDTATPLPVLRCFAGFILGMAVYRLKDTGIGQALAGRPLYGDLLALGLIVLLFIPVGDVAFVLVATALILHLTVSDSLTSRALESPPMHYLGLVSYSIYLVHIPLIMLMRTLAAHLGLPYLLANLAGIVLTLVVAPLTYRFIELPGRNLIRRLIEPRRVRAPAAWG